MIVMRPCDANEVVEAYKVAMQHATYANDGGTDAANATDLRPHEICSGLGSGKGRLRFDRRRRAASLM